MMRKYLLVLVLSLLPVVSIGCATMPVSQEEGEASKYVANFSYEPAVQAAPGSVEVTFIIEDLNYTYHPKTDIVEWYKAEQLANLSDAIRQDLQKILLAKGFNVRGPFDSYDLIPFPDKKATDLYLIPKLELSVTERDKKDGYGDILLTTYLRSGKVEVSGKIILEAREIFTRELMWSKSIPLSNFEFPYEVRYSSMGNKGFDLTDTYMNGVAKGLEKQYPDLMATIFKLIDSEEMRIIKKHCQELKSQKGY